MRFALHIWSANYGQKVDDLIKTGDIKTVLKMNLEEFGHQK